MRLHGILATAEDAHPILLEDLAEGQNAREADLYGECTHVAQS
jgi:hypothetical protein